MAADTYISNAVHSGHHNDTDIIYGVLRDTAKKARDVVAGAWDTYADADLGDYDISAAAAAGGLWSGSFPVEVDNGFYIYQFRIRAGANPASGDRLLYSTKGYWNGAVFTEANFNASGLTVAANYVGDYEEDETVYFLWHTKTTPSTAGTVKVYKTDGTAEVTIPTGITDTRNFDSKTGVHLCKVDLSANVFYAKSKDYSVVLSGAVIDGLTVNAVIATFSIENRHQGVVFERDV